MKFREPAQETRTTVAAVVATEGQRPVEWQVRGADGARPNRVERFSGDDALLRSLRFAHEEYSRVRWLMN